MKLHISKHLDMSSVIPELFAGQGLTLTCFTCSIEHSQILYLPTVFSYISQKLSNLLLMKLDTNLKHDIISAMPVSTVFSSISQTLNTLLWGKITQIYIMMQLLYCLLTLAYFSQPNGGGRVVRWSWVNFQYRGVLQFR